MTPAELKKLYERWEAKRNPLKVKNRTIQKARASVPKNYGSHNTRGGSFGGLVPLTTIFPDRGFYNGR